MIMLCNSYNNAIKSTIVRNIVSKTKITALVHPLGLFVMLWIIGRLQEAARIQ